MRYQPSPAVQERLIAEGLERFAEGADLDDGEFARIKSEFWCHPVHQGETGRSLEDRVGYFMLCRDHGVQEGSGRDASSNDVVTAKRIVVMHETLREVAREHLPALVGGMNAQAEGTKRLAGVQLAMSAAAAKDAAQLTSAIQGAGDVIAAEVKAAMQEFLSRGKSALLWLLLGLGLLTAATLLAPKLHGQNVDIQRVRGGTTFWDGVNTAFRVNCVSGCTAASSFADNGAFTFGTTSISLSGFVVDDTGTNAVAENSAGLARMTANRVIYMDLSLTGANTTAIKVDGSAVTQPVSGTFWQATQPISGTVTATQATGTNLHIVCDSGCGGAATFADDDPFTISTTSINISGGLFDDVAPTAATENSAAAPRISGNRNWYFQLRDGAGNERGANVTASNALVVDGSAVTQPVSAASLPLPTGAATATLQLPDGHNVTVDNAAGAAAVNIQDGGNAITVDGTVTVGTFPDNEPFNLAQVGGTATVTGGVAGSQGVGGLAAEGAAVAGSPVLAGAKDHAGLAQPLGCYESTNCVLMTTFTATDTDGASNTTNVPIGNAAGTWNMGVADHVFNGTTWDRKRSGGTTGSTMVAGTAASGAAPSGNPVYVGGLGSGATGGFMTAFPVCDTQAVVNISTATTTLIVTGVSGRHVRICAFSLLTAAANNVAFISGTGATCGTGTAGMSGGTTAASGYNFAANGGMAQGSGIGTVLKTIATGDSVCLVTSAATQLSGQLSYSIY